MRTSVIGCGRWGTFVAWYLGGIGHEVTLYGREASWHMRRLMDTRSNDYLTLPETVRLSTRMEEATEADAVFVSVGAQQFRGLCRTLQSFGLKERPMILCMKGLEIGTGCRLSQVAQQELDPSVRVAVWLGPGHVQDFVQGIPNCMVIDSDDETTKRTMTEELSGGLIRFYLGGDMIGNEIGAAAKNVIGIAAGVLDGLGLTSLKGALMARGAHEIAGLIGRLGGREISAYGLCHLGDYEATVFSPHSHNRRFGEAFVKGTPFNELAEGYYTAKAIMELGRQAGTELPICQAVYASLYEKADVRQAIDALFRRSTKKEF
ncbi:MAG: NAD(P)H-dependent glycerol-3-phosphate dehydrogenase [Oscillospiraceae bacterium]|nr:NAD(P)H-dependent glycerol-3-phosphate dehydrogenase [Oscillospiraceae bacterium]